MKETKENAVNSEIYCGPAAAPVGTAQGRASSGSGMVSAIYIWLEMVKARQRWLDFPSPHVASQWELACGLP